MTRLLEPFKLREIQSSPLPIFKVVAYPEAFAYNFVKIHRTLRMSPALAAGVTDRLWSVEDLVAL